MRGILRAAWPLALALALCTFFIGMALPRISLPMAGSGILLAALMLIWTLHRGFRRMEAFFKGARGEERVALVLTDLPGEYHVFHDLTVNNEGSIDHVVVGPQGIFVLETKFWAGKVALQQDTLLVNDTVPSRKPLRQVLQATELLAEFLAAHLHESPGCTPILCFANNNFTGGLTQHMGITICNASELCNYLVTGPEKLATQDIERITKIMGQIR